MRFQHYMTVLQDQLSFKSPLVIALAVLCGPVVAFFNVPIFLFLNLFLIIDFITGLYKARCLKKVCSQRFGDMFNRMVLYTIVFVIFHVITLVMPVAAYIEATVFMGYLSKEGLSVLENLSAIQYATGINYLNLDRVISVFGMDLQKILMDNGPREIPTPAKETK